MARQRTSRPEAVGAEVVANTPDEFAGFQKKKAAK